ncbi:hypothetical protein HRG84_23610 [Flavisolibacter sp. BT320]|nr:hypothetical protein [Flavisolibacter longurius]
MKLEQFKGVVTELVQYIVERDFEKIKSLGWMGRVQVEDLKRVIEEYGCTIIPLPNEAFELSKVYYIKDDSRLDVYIPLWTEEEGRSDLTLFLSAKQQNGHQVVEINDLRVL